MNGAGMRVARQLVEQWAVRFSSRGLKLTTPFSWTWNVCRRRTSMLLSLEGREECLCSLGTNGSGERSGQRDQLVRSTDQIRVEWLLNTDNNPRAPIQHRCFLSMISALRSIDVEPSSFLAELGS